MHSRVPLVFMLGVSCLLAQAQTPANRHYDFNDVHCHLTNYIQEGTDVRRMLEIMGTRVGANDVMLSSELQWTHRANNADGFTVSDIRLQFSFTSNFHLSVGGQ